jgi:hypothetical protein
MAGVAGPKVKRLRCVLNWYCLHSQRCFYSGAALTGGMDGWYSLVLDIGMEDIGVED